MSLSFSCTTLPLEGKKQKQKIKKTQTIARLKIAGYEVMPFEPGRGT
jgi:hypothetical protein